jgi:gamma-glutamyl-gamma-aminobutyrate hydrolase PuuD
MPVPAAKLYPDTTSGGVVSIHHQAIKALGRGCASRRAALPMTA